MNTIAKFILSIGLAISSLFGHHSQQPQSFVAGSSFTPVGTTQFTLAGSGVTSLSSTIQLTSFLLPDRVTPITMSMIGSIGYGVIEPQTNNIEDITFTGVTQNANGTATLTGVSRGISFYTPYAASTTLAHSHAGGSYFILSNTAGFYGQQFLFSNSVGSSTEVISYSPSNPPQYYPSVGLQHTGTYNSTTSEFASIDYVNQTVLSGGANASASVKGVVQIASSAQTAAGTGSGSTGALLVAPNSLFNSAQSATTIVPVTNSSGKLSQSFLDLTQAFTWSGANIFTSSTNTFNSLARFNVAPEFGTFNATSSLTTSTSTISGNLQILKNATTTNLTVSGVCTNCVGPNTVTNTGAGPTTQGTSASVTATCAAGQKVAGGGGSNSSTNGTVFLVASNPSGGNSWVATYETYAAGGTIGANTMTAYAICVNP